MNKRTYRRMVAELRQLSNRIDKLNVFTVTDTYDRLPLQEKMWIKDQLMSMRWYYKALTTRVNFYKEQEDD